MEVSEYIACNQIPPRELVQGVYPLKPVCWLSEEAEWSEWEVWED